MKYLINIKVRICVVLFIFFSVNSGFAQYKLSEIPYDPAIINNRNVSGKQGVWYFYDKSDSTIFAMQNFKNDTLCGYFERYWLNGKISEKGFYKNGQIDSVFIGYWENGAIRGQAYYTNGMLNGIATSFNQINEVTSRIKYLNGVIDNSYDEFFVDGNLAWDTNTRNKIDTLKNIYISAWNKKYTIYLNDSLIKDISFYKDVKAIENFYEKTILSKRIVYLKVKPFSIQKIFYYLNEKLIKTEFYNKDGKLVLEE